MLARKLNGNVISLTLLGGAIALAYVVRDHLKTPFDSIFDRMGAKYNIPPNLLRAIARHESKFNPKARNPVVLAYPDASYDVGLMQVNTKTGKHFGYTPDALKEPNQNVECACKYLVAVQKELGANNSIYAWAASYNTGAARVGTSRGATYASAVIYHWQLYEIGRVLA